VGYGLKYKIVNKLAKLLIPAKLEAVLYYVLGFIILASVDTGQFFNQLSGENRTESLAASTAITRAMVTKMQGFEAVIDPRFIDMTVWALIGCVLVTVVLVADTIIRNLNSEVRLIEYISRPKSQQNELRLYAIRLGIRLATVLFLVIFARLLLMKILPTVAGIFYANIVSFNDFTAVYIVLAGPAVVGLSLYVFAIGSRLIVLRTRVFR
jgi:hypothetical protein